MSVRFNHASPLARDILAFWPFINGNTAGGVSVPDSSLLLPMYADISGNGYHLSPNNGKSTTAPTRNANYLTFDGANDVLGNDDDAFKGSGSDVVEPDTTLFIEFRLADTTGAQHLIGNARANNYAYHRRIRTNNTELRIAGEHNNTGGEYIATSSLTAGQWYSVAARFGSDSGVAINGQLVATGETAEKGYSYHFGIGAARYAGAEEGQPFAGDIRAAGAWSRGLSDSELVSLSANPWQLLQPRRLLVSVGVPVSAVSATLGGTVLTGTPLDETHIVAGQKDGGNITIELDLTGDTWVA